MSPNPSIPPKPDQDLDISDSSVKSSQLGQAGRNLTQIQASVVKIIKKPVNIAVATITAVVGTIGIVFAGKQNIINIKGNVDRGATVANELTIYEGDPPEVRQRKLEAAKQLIVEEILTNIANLDARLGFVGNALADDHFDEQLQKVRDQVAPSFSQSFASGYRRLMRQNEVSSLRGAFASRPLYEVREALIQVLIEGKADAERVRAFYNSLTEVQDVSESLFQELSSIAARTSTNPKVIAHHEKRIKLAVKRLINRSEIAHLSGLMVLDSLKIPLPNAQDRLGALQYLSPRQIVSTREATQLLAKQLQESEQLLAERVAIVEEAKTIRDSALNEYEKLNEQLVIKPSDPWNVVLGKAVSLRQLGRTTEAIAAFSRYGEMFAEKDPTAKQYTRTAQQFTLQLGNFGVNGGVYLYEIVNGGAAEHGGLKAGDIILGYGGKTIANMDDITMALRDAIPGNSIRLTYLRISNAGTFQRQTVTINAGPLGAWMMPI